MGISFPFHVSLTFVMRDMTSVALATGGEPGDPFLNRLQQQPHLIL